MTPNHTKVKAALDRRDMRRAIAETKTDIAMQPETRHIVQRRDKGGDWQFHMTAPLMTEAQAREIAADHNRKLSRHGEFRAVRVTTVTEVLE